MQPAYVHLAYFHVKMDEVSSEVLNHLRKKEVFSEAIVTSSTKELGSKLPTDSKLLHSSLFCEVRYF